MAPAELVVSKVISYHQRRGKPKAGTDWRDLAMLLLTFPAFPELKVESGSVLDGLVAADVDESVVSLWREIAAMEIEASDEDDEF